MTGKGKPSLFWAYFVPPDSLRSNELHVILMGILIFYVKNEILNPLMMLYLL